MRKHLWKWETRYIHVLIWVFSAVVVLGIAKTARLRAAQAEAGNQRQERLCNHFIHLITVLPDGRVQFPGKPGQWTNIDLYVEKEVPGVMQLVEIRDFSGNGHRWQKLMIVERRCGD